MKIEERVKRLEKKVDELVTKLDTSLGKEMPVKLDGEDHKLAKKESAREYFLKFNPKSDTEKTLVIINFLEKKGLTSITAREIANAFKEMREPLPKNVSDKIQMLDKRGLVVLAGQEGKRKCWLISNTGEGYLRRLRKNEE